MLDLAEVFIAFELVTSLHLTEYCYNGYLEEEIIDMEEEVKDYIVRNCQQASSTKANVKSVKEIF